MTLSLARPVHLLAMMRASTVLTVSSGLLRTIEVGLNAASVISVGQLLASVIDDTRGDSVDVWLAILVSSLIGRPLFGGIAEVVIQRQQFVHVLYIQERLASLPIMLANAPLNSDARDALRRLQILMEETRDDDYLEGIEATWEYYGSRLSAITSLLLVCYWNAAIGIALALAWTLMSRKFDAWSSTIQQTLRPNDTVNSRRSSYYRDVLLSTSSAKSIRVYGFTGWLQRAFRESWLQSAELTWNERKSAILPIYRAGILVLLLNVGGMLLLVSQALGGQIPAEVFVVVLISIPRLVAFGMLGTVQMNVRNLRSIEQRLAAVEDDCMRRNSEIHEIVGRSFSGPVGIDLEGVGFRYEEGAAPVLNGLSMSIKSGESVAIVGVNGAGKTTFLKLLLGALHPTEGDLNFTIGDEVVEADALKIGVVLQDFSRYPLSECGNIWLNEAANRADPAVRRTPPTINNETAQSKDSLSQESLREPFADLALSEGQWQYVAFQRAMHSHGGNLNLLLLDEPSAALDSGAERALFDSIADLGRTYTTVVVTHRLSVARRADRIFVFGSGHVIETGTHDELMDMGGAYNEMFEVQAQQFEEEPTS